MPKLTLHSSYPGGRVLIVEAANPQELAELFTQAELTLGPLFVREQPATPTAPQPVHVSSPADVAAAVGAATHCPAHGVRFAKPSQFKNGGYFCTSPDPGTKTGYCSWRSDRTPSQRRQAS